MYASFLLPYISTPSRRSKAFNTLKPLTPRSKTFIDNIFSYNIKNGSMSGNIVATISDHYAQFLLLKIQITKIQQTVKCIIKISKNLIKIT